MVISRFERSIGAFGITVYSEKIRIYCNQCETEQHSYSTVSWQDDTCPDCRSTDIDRIDE